MNFIYRNLIFEILLQYLNKITQACTTIPNNGGLFEVRLRLYAVITQIHKL